MKKDLNHHARDSLVYQITEAMDDLRQKSDNIQAALNYMEQARNSSYTNPMNEVRTLLKIAHDRLDTNFGPDQMKALSLAGVAQQIHIGETE